MTLDDIRAQRPELGFALYAYEPGGPVTLEVHAPNGDVVPFTAPTEAAAIELAFPESAVGQVPAGAGSSPAFQTTGEGRRISPAPEAVGAAPIAGVFD